MKRKYLVPIFLILLLFGFAKITKAQNDARSYDPSVDYTYGKELRFSLQVDNALDVQQLRLFFRPELSTNIYEVEVPFIRGDSISVTQTIDVSSLDIRPFGDVAYFWELKTADGVQTVPERSFTYEDDRFAWQAVLGNGANVHWIGEDLLFGQSVLDIVDTSLSNLAEIIPLEKVDPIDIYIYPSTADIREALRLTGYEDDPNNQLNLGAILVASVNSQTADSDLKQSIPYELAHLLLYRTVGEQISSVPWWVREGIAGDARLNNNPRHDQVLLEALSRDETYPLWRLCTQPQDSADREELAVIQSVSLVRFLSQDQSTGTIPDLLSVYINGDDCEQGVQRVLGYSLDELESVWLASFQEPASAQTILNDAALWMLLLAAGTLLSLVLLRVTRQKG